MIIDWLIYGLIIWGLAVILNRTAFRDKSATRIIAWALSIFLFFLNIIALSAAKFLRYQIISEDLGLKITPNSFLDISGAFVFSYLFFTLLKKKSNAKRVINRSVTPYNIKETSAAASPKKEAANKQPHSFIEDMLENDWLDQGCSKEAIDYLKNPIHVYSYMQKYKKTEEKILDAIKKGKLRGCYVGEALWVENKKI